MKLAAEINMALHKKSGLAFTALSNICAGAALIGTSVAFGLVPPPGLTLATWGINSYLGLVRDENRIEM